MNEHLKLKYRAVIEPRSKYNNPRFKNCPQWGGGKSGNQGKSRSKKIIKPPGFSGRTIGAMLRRMSSGNEKKK